jgi:hypothetical protein
MNRLAALVLALFACPTAAIAQAALPHNVILFVPDGLRALSVTPDSAPTMAAVRDKGVNFKNSHSLFPTFTTANASALATGHYLGDTGDYSNTIYVGRPIESAEGSVTPALNSNRVPRELDEHFGGNYLNEETVLKAARARGFSTAPSVKARQSSSSITLSTPVKGQSCSMTRLVVRPVFRCPNKSRRRCEPQTCRSQRHRRPIAMTYEIGIAYCPRLRLGGAIITNPWITVRVLSPVITLDPRGTGEPWHSAIRQWD